MIKTTVYIEEEEAAALRRLAAQTGRSQADLIREAISKTTRAMGPRRIRSAAVGKGTGEAIARRADEIIRAELGQSKR